MIGNRAYVNGDQAQFVYKASTKTIVQMWLLHTIPGKQLSTDVMFHTDITKATLAAGIPLPNNGTVIDVYLNAGESIYAATDDYAIIGFAEKRWEQ